MDYCGVGAHHQNGVTERNIHTVSEAACALIHCPVEVSMDLWPFPIKYTVYLYNKILHGKSMSSLEDIKSDHSELLSAKVFGFPTYVLDPRIQDGKKNHLLETLFKNEVFGRPTYVLDPRIQDGK